MQTNQTFWQFKITCIPFGLTKRGMYQSCNEYQNDVTIIAGYYNEQTEEETYHL